MVFPSLTVLSARVADDWHVSDGLTHTFKIKQGIKFHNGSELASDVAFSMNRLLTIKPLFIYRLCGICKHGDYEVEFRLKKTYGPFISLVRLLIVSEEEYGEY